ncbi:TonB-dependent siderophore receptor [Marinobacter bohaiensis]|uniref:TonB-dependent siderophore receptor n=1 Tax=Marinobacter bohaiensis TaxID=2201898 RepID=UPI000DABFD10|nr:TonB-dependent siderophore receptor [Marinobacter bohaiensis]
MTTGASTHSPTRYRRRVLASALLLSTGLTPMLLPASANAQTSTQQAASALQAENTFNIPAQPMTPALALFGQQSDLQITVDGSLVRDLQAPAVNGTLSNADALGQLLLGSGLSYSLADANTVVVEAAAEVSDDATPLDPLQVQASAESAVGPVTDSVVNSRSATGTKMDTPIVDTSASVSVITEEELETRNVQDLQQALSYTSSVSVDAYGSDDRYDFYRIRGFNQMSLGTYRDGLPSRIPSFTTSRIEPYGLQQIDVLKGSTSSLFGLNGPGGLVNAITKRPQSTEHGEVFVTGGDEHLSAGTDFGGPVDDDGKWSYRLTGLWQDGTHGRDYSNDDRFYIAPAVTYQPSDRTSLTLLANFSKRDSNAGYGFPADADIDPESFLGEPDFNRFDTTESSLGYLFSHQFSDALTFRQTARYSHIDLDYEQVYGGTTDPSVDRTAFSVDGEADRFGIDNQLQYDTALTDSIDSRTLFGMDYTYDKDRETTLLGSAPGIDIYDPVYCGRACVDVSTVYQDYEPEQNAYGVYAQEELTFNDRWILTLGGRYDYFDADVHYFTTDTDESTTAESFTSRAGLTYKITDGLSVYGNYSESFQPLYAPSANGYSVEGSLEPQEGTQYEVGMKYQPATLDALFTVALFDLTQTNVPTNVTPVIQRQVGKIGNRGAEFEAKMSLARNTNMTLAYSYWDAEIEEDGIGGNEGNRPSAVPEHLASAWVDHTFPANGARGDVTIGGGVRYVGSTYGDDANTVPVDAYTVADAMVRYQITPKLGLSVNATNLLDEEYVVTSYYGTNYYGDGRTVLGTLKYAW